MKRGYYVAEVVEEYLAIAWDAAACRGAPTESFFPIDTGQRVEELARALSDAYCRACPIMVECKEWALRHESEGIWAGLTPRARRAIRKAG